jgi:hypothetical protein
LSPILLNEDEFRNTYYLQRQVTSFENTALAIKEGASGIFLSGLAILSRTEGEMTTLKEFSENAMLLHGMDGHPDWKNRQTSSLAGVHPNNILQVKYSIGEKKNLLTRNMIYCPLT